VAADLCSRLGRGPSPGPRGGGCWPWPATTMYGFAGAGAGGPGGSAPAPEGAGRVAREAGTSSRCRAALRSTDLALPPGPGGRLSLPTPRGPGRGGRGLRPWPPISAPGSAGGPRRAPGAGVAGRGRLLPCTASPAQGQAGLVARPPPPRGRGGLPGRLAPALAAGQRCALRIWHSPRGRVGACPSPPPAAQAAGGGGCGRGRRSLLQARPGALAGPPGRGLLAVAGYYHVRLRRRRGRRAWWLGPRPRGGGAGCPGGWHQLSLQGSAALCGSGTPPGAGWAPVPFPFQRRRVETRRRRRTRTTTATHLGRGFRAYKPGMGATSQLFANVANLACRCAKKNLPPSR
jgi:hypothetical protein